MALVPHEFEIWMAIELGSSMGTRLKNKSNTHKLFLKNIVFSNIVIYGCIIFLEWVVSTFNGGRLTIKFSDWV